MLYSEISDRSEKLIISEMINPWTLKDSGYIICKTDFDWEKREGNIIEGAFVHKKNGRIFIIYSTNDTFSPYYCLGVLEYIGDDPLSAGCYKKSTVPLFEGGEGVIAPGHACVFSYNNDDYLCFHANPVKDQYDRFAYVKRIGYDDFGFPVI